MKSKVNPQEKNLHPQQQGKPKSKPNAFKMLKVRPEVYFQLQEVKEDISITLRRKCTRPTLNKTIAFLLDFYKKTKAEAKKGPKEEFG